MPANVEREGSGTTPLDADAVDPGTSVLIAGPAMTGKRRLMFDLVGGSPDRAAVFVTTKRGADRIRSGFTESRERPAEWTIRFVDCVSRSRGFGQTDDAADVAHVTSASDLTGVGIAASGFMREFYHADSAARVGLHSLSTLLMYADLRRVYQFTHVLTGRIEASGFSGAFTLDTTTRDSETVERLKQLFDAYVAVRDTESGPQIRVRGGEFGPDEWTPF